MKKFCILLALLLALCTLCACPQSVEKETTAAGLTTTEPATIDPALIEAYKPIQDEFARLAKEGPEDHGAWEALGFKEVPQEPKEGALGYAVIDINGDGIPELLLMEKDSWANPGEPAINALYTLQKREPVLIGQYWSRSRGHLGKDGRLFTVGSGSAESVYLDSYELKPGAAELTHMTEYYTDVGKSGKPYWVMKTGGTEESLSETQFNTLLGLYEKPEYLMRFEFVPVN